MTEATDTTDSEETLSLSEALIIARFATAIAESLLSVAAQKGVDVETMTFEINGDGEEMLVTKALAVFKHKLDMKTTSTANPRD